MTASRSAARPGAASGFTLLEVLAGVLVLGLLYTVLASSALTGLASEGRDRRRAEASLIADRELAGIESQLLLGAVLEPGQSEREEPPYRIAVEVAGEDVMALLPWDPRVPAPGGDLATLLVDERGESRVQRISVVVEWDEGGEPDSVRRTTYGFDASTLAEYFPAEGGGEPGSDETLTEDTEEERLLQQLRSDTPTEDLLHLLQSDGGGPR